MSQPVRIFFGVLIVLALLGLVGVAVVYGGYQKLKGVES